MTAHQRRWLLLICVGVFALSGASCPQFLQQYASPLPRLLPPSPTLEQVVEVVNRNNSQIRSFSTDRASLSATGSPTLRASVAFQRPNRFRLRAETGLTGAELDLGSNDDIFWFWMRRNQPPAVYFCRHEQSAIAQLRQAMPFDPAWLIEALGVAELDPALPHQGPTFLPNDRLRIDTIRNTPGGPVTLITILDGSQGWILEQHLFDARRRLLANSAAKGHRRDPLSGLVMPTSVEINCPAAQLSMRLDLGNVEINRIVDNPALWTMPNYPGTPAIDMASPNFQPPTATTARRIAPPSTVRRVLR